MSSGEVKYLKTSTLLPHLNAGDVLLSRSYDEYVIYTVWGFDENDSKLYIVTGSGSEEKSYELHIVNGRYQVVQEGDRFHVIFPFTNEERIEDVKNIFEPNIFQS